MKIKHSNNNSCYFSNVECGDVFVYNNVYYMKTEYMCTINCNAVNIASGTFCHFEDTDKVKFVDCELVIT